MKTLLFVLIILCSCTSKKKRIANEIKAQQTLIDSLKDEAIKTLKGIDYADGNAPNYKKLSDYDKQIERAQRSIDSLNMELKKY